MKDRYFYSILDKQLDEIILEFNDYFVLKNIKDNDQKKSHAFNIWFLKNYGVSNSDVINSITEGSGDNSADSIFKLKNNDGNYEYYVLQSKWNNIKNCESNMDSGTLHGIITEFEEIKKGKSVLRDTINENFNNKYIELLNHKNQNFKVNFIILAFKRIIFDSKDEKRINDFNSDKKFNEIFIYDINKLKIDYIENIYKGYKVRNPLISPKKPMEDISLKLLPLNDEGKFRFIKFPSPEESYVFCIKPKQIYELFLKYEYSIFQDNIRNPLIGSSINEKIIETLKNNPSKFWYYNNGITGITKIIYPFDGNNENSELKIKGLQIINGGQTFKTIYEYYSGLNSQERELLDENVKIMFKIIKSPSNDFDLNITRFTNLQNKVEPRDFLSSDNEQIRIQKDFMKYTNIWYETRRGEFVKKAPKDIYIIENTYFAQSYLASVLGFPEKAKSQLDKVFILNKDGGLYNDIFNEKTNYLDLFISYGLYHYIIRKEKEYRKKYNFISKKIKMIVNYKLLTDEENIIKKDFILHSSYHILMVFKKYLDNKGLEYMKKHVIDEYWYKDSYTELEKIYNEILLKIEKHIILKKSTPGFTLTKYFKGSEASKDLRRLFGV